MSPAMVAAAAMAGEVVDAREGHGGAMNGRDIGTSKRADDRGPGHPAAR